MNGTLGDSKQGDGLAAAKEPTTSLRSSKTVPTSAAKLLMTRAFLFLSTASTETICGIAFGLAACIYFVLGRIGLILIGVLGGVVLHASWEGQTNGSIEDMRKEKGLDIVKRLLDLRNEDTRPEEDDEEEGKELNLNSFEGFRSETGIALNDLVDAVIRDYVKSWYHPMLPNEQSFPTALRQTLTKFLLSISQHLSRKRPADSFLDFLTNSSSIVIVFLNELSSALTPQVNVPAAEAVHTYLSANPESNLANVLNEKVHAKKFKMIADDILQNFLEKQTYECGPARIFLRELLAGVVLDSTLKACSKPEWINGWILYFLEDGKPDLSLAIDAGIEAGTGNGLLNNPFNDLDGNMGNVGLAKPPKSQKEKQTKQEVQRHKKRLSKAEEAMEEAMEEAKRLSQLIAEEDAKNVLNVQNSTEAVPKALVAAVEQNAQSLELNTEKLPKSPLPQPPSMHTSNDPQSSISKKPLNPFKPQRADAQEPATKGAIESLQYSKPFETPTLQEAPTRNMMENPVSPYSMNPVAPPSSTNNRTSFTNFDQIVPQPILVSLQNGSPTPRRKTIPLTLHNASITIYDDSTPTENGKLRNKPSGDYLVQIEPASPQHPGWMIVRKYPDFETLHEVVRRIAQVSGVAAFTEQHHTLPGWKEHTKASLRGELERYIRDALWYQPLAESEGMKRFLEKDQRQPQPGTKNGPGIGWPSPSAFETMGKGMLDVLTSAPKGVAEGGKAIGGGITGVFSNIGNLAQKKPNINSANVGMHSAARSSTFITPVIDSTPSITGSRKGRASEDSLRPSPIVQTQPPMVPPMERRPSYNSIAEDDNERDSRISTSARSSMSASRSAHPSREPSRAPSRKTTPLSSPVYGNLDKIVLPPPPSDIPDDYGSHSESSGATHSRTESIGPTTRTSTSTAPSQQSPGRQSVSIPRNSSILLTQVPARKTRKEPAPLSEQETRVAVELLFAVINELYTLSSAWNIRRTLLTAAKTFLLRPGNPSLFSIQSLIQDSVIASNTSDSAIASHLCKLRENSLPTEEELKAWPKEMSSEEKECLRIKARKLLVERGVPAALTGVMGQAATGEAMGRVFDCLQVEEVARGLMFGLLLQGVRAVTH